MRGFCFLVLFLPALALASDNLEELRQCSQIVDDAERLACYDLSVAPKTSDIGNESRGFAWQTTIKIDPLTDAKVLTAVLNPKDGPVSKGLIVRCISSGELSIYLAWDDYLNDDNPRVITRFDKDDPWSLQWSKSTDQTATFAPRVKEFFERLLESSRLVARTVPYNESPVVLIFDTAGLEQALGKNINICR